MREINAEIIKNTVSDMCIETNCILCDDIRFAIENARKTETNPVAKNILDSLIENADIAKKELIPICQDTGMAVFFIEVGQEVFVKGSLTDAVNDGVREGYEKGYLRKSVVKDPLKRENTGDNTPAIIHYNIVSGDKIKITAAPKGFGSENMSAVCMLKPSQGIEGVKSFVVETVRKASSNPCPPVVVGVGIGGSFEKAALMAKQALTRPVDSQNSDEFYAALEDELLCEINKLGIGPQGFGGDTTALGVNIETYPTHIAGLPVAVNISCHVTRHVTKII